MKFKKYTLATLFMLYYNFLFGWVQHPVYFTEIDFEDITILPSSHSKSGKLILNGTNISFNNARNGSGAIPAVFGTSNKFLSMYTWESTHAVDRTEYNHVSHIPFNNNYYFGFYLFVPSSAQNPTGWQLFYQWHQAAPYSPPLSLNWATNGDYVLQLRTLTNSNTNAPQYTYNNIYRASLPRGQWVKFVVQVEFGLNNTGYVRLWVNNVLKATFSGNVGYSISDQHINTKFGIYRQSALQTCNILFDDVRVGTSYSQVNDF